MIEIPEDLQGGSTKVTKMGNRVLRARHQGSTNVEWLLTVLERRGFRYSPRFVGLSDDGRQVLEFMEGRAGNYPLPAALRSDDALISAARALRLLHEVTSDLATEVLDGWMLEAVEPYEVICHGDFAPYNCVFDESRLVGIIDFDTAHPGPRIRDIAYAIYRFAPLTRKRRRIRLSGRAGSAGSAVLRRVRGGESVSDHRGHVPTAARSGPVHAFSGGAGRHCVPIPSRRRPRHRLSA